MLQKNKTGFIGQDLSQRNSLRRKLIKNLPYFIMILPGMLYLLINNYLPMFGLLIAFKEVDFSLGILKSPWVGLDNFKFLIASDAAIRITKNTLIHNFVFIITTNLVAIMVAIFLSIVVNRTLLKFYQSAILLPYLLSMAVVSFLVYAFLNTDLGIVNRVILPRLGIDPISWYASPFYWYFILPIVNLWKLTGYQCLIYLASIVGIDETFYEAAEMDGVSPFRQIIHITIPLIRPTIIVLVLLGIGKIFYTSMGLFLLVPMDSGLLYRSTSVIDTFVYRSLLQLGDFGMASAAGFYQSLVGFVLVLLANSAVRKISPDEALF